MKKKREKEYPMSGKVIRELEKSEMKIKDLMKLYEKDYKKKK